MGNLSKVIRHEYKDGKKAIKVNLQGKTTIFIRYSHGEGEMVYFSTGVRIEPKYWNGDKSACIKKSLRGYTVLLDSVQSTIDNINTAIRSIIVSKLEPTPKRVQDEYRNLKDENKDEPRTENILKLFDEYITDNKAVHAHNTTKGYKSTRNNLEEYLTFKKIKPVLKALNKKFYDNYVRYLLSERKKDGKPNYMTSNSAGKEIKNLKAFLNNLQSRGYSVEADFSSWKVLKEKSLIIYLTQEEFDQLLDYELTGHTYEKTRDLFIFQCRTGLRFSDLKRIGKQHIQGNCIELKTHKAKTTATIPITTESRQILEKYDYELPTIAEQYYNRTLKKLCKLVGINAPIEVTEVRGGLKVHKTIPKHQEISSHIAVKTFISHCGERGIPAKTVSEITGKSVKVILDHYYGTNKQTIEDHIFKAFG